MHRAEWAVATRWKNGKRRTRALLFTFPRGCRLFCKSTQAACNKTPTNRGMFRAFTKTFLEGGPAWRAGAPSDEDSGMASRARAQVRIRTDIRTVYTRSG